jgi:hypothetical protein
LMGLVDLVENINNMIISSEDVGANLDTII